MDANQKELRNPFGMDTDCENCPELCGPRDRVVHGYGDGGGEFLVGGARPNAPAEANGIPFTGAGAGERIQSIFADLGFVRSAPDASEPDVQNAFFTNLTRCRHPEREPTDSEVETCEPFLNAEIRMI
ncbi:uracil-DNA glycosylase, partial [Halorubrum sp. E3]